MADCKKIMVHDILQLAWPVILEMFCLLTVNILVTAMVGSLGSVALAAVALSNLVQMAANMIFAAAGTGAAAIVAREAGAKNGPAVRQISGQAMLLGFLSGIVLSGIGITGIFYVFAMVKADPAIAALSIDLLKITFLFTYVDWQCYIAWFGKNEIGFLCWLYR